MGFKSWLKSNDFFGHKVELNFNKKGSTHNTTLGGFASILVKIALCLYVGILVKKFWLYEDDKNTST
jgi:hypothetical protein